jgi:hypothetical protein
LCVLGVCQEYVAQVVFEASAGVANATVHLLASMAGETMAKASTEIYRRGHEVEAVAAVAWLGVGRNGRPRVSLLTGVG